jgi:hypothetical protein
MNDTIEAMVKRLSDYGVPEDNVMGIRWARVGIEGKGLGLIGTSFRVKGKGLGLDVRSPACGGGGGVVA